MLAWSAGYENGGPILPSLFFGAVYVRTLRGTNKFGSFAELRRVLRSKC